MMALFESIAFSFNRLLLPLTLFAPVPFNSSELLQLLAASFCVLLSTADDWLKENRGNFRADCTGSKSLLSSSPNEILCCLAIFY